jgi:DedD protein
MGLFSFLRKNKQDAAPGKSDFRSQSDEPFTNARARPKRSKEAAPDPILPEKKRARRRLIGAVVLVLAVVIVLPMILDPEPKPLADDIAIQIPSKDTKTPPVPVKEADAAALDPSEELVDTKPAEKPVEKPVEKAVEKPAERTVEKPVEKAVEKSAAAEKPVEKAVEKRVEKPAPAPARTEKAEAPAAPRPAAKPTEEERALAILHGKPLPADKTATAGKPVDKSSGRFVIQVAALATQEKVDELRNKLTAAGIKSYTQKVATQSGSRTRIRVGPFASRDEAEKTRVKINKIGLSATLVPT